MGRRKKEPEAVHRSQIALAAERLFMARGIKATTMEEIAKEAGYSKATIYVYFQNKEEIINTLALKSMTTLYEYLHQALAESKNTKAKYQGICNALILYQEQFPFYFELAIGEIHVNPANLINQRNPVDSAESANLKNLKNPANPCSLPVERQLFAMGEQINEEIARFLEAGMKAGVIRTNLPVLQTVFAFWAMLSGLIKLAVHKQDYIEKSMGVTKREFLQNGFDILYYSIAKERQEK